MMQPLAPFGNSLMDRQTNLSTLISFALFDEQENIISLSMNGNNSIEIILPRDVNMIQPEMIRQNCTLSNQSFFYHFVNLTTMNENNWQSSISFEMKSIDSNLSYFFLYKFDQIPRIDDNDGWSFFCPSNQSIYKYFLPNDRLSSHQSIIFALRELTSNEKESFCSTPISTKIPLNSSSKFTSDYELLIYSSACLYLDEDLQWKSDGLVVSIWREVR